MLWFADAQHGLDGLAGYRIPYGLIDFVKRVKPYEAVEGKLSFPIQLD
jgi:hypothetical protein